MGNINGGVSIMRHNYCTVYSQEYVYMGLIVYNSLLRYDQDFCLYIFFMDNEALEIMKGMNTGYMEYTSLGSLAFKRGKNVIEWLKWYRDNVGEYR